MNQYETMLKYVNENGTYKSDRTGTGTKSIFGYQMRFDLQQGFPMVTTKKLHLKSIVYELLWFLKGDTNIKYLKDNVQNGYLDKKMIELFNIQRLSDSLKIEKDELFQYSVRYLFLNFHNKFLQYFHDMVV